MHKASQRKKEPPQVWVESVIDLEEAESDF